MSQLTVTTVITDTINASSSDTVSFNANGITISTGNTANRPLSAENGTLRFNTDTETFEGYREGWEALGSYITMGTKAMFKGNDIEIAEDIQLRDKHVYMTSINQSTNEFITSSHDFVNGDIIQIGATTSVPTGVSANTNYYVIDTTSSNFKVSTTRGGTAANLQSTGSGTISFWKPMNTSTVGPFTVANSYTVTVANGSVMVVL